MLCLEKISKKSFLILSLYFVLLTPITIKAQLDGDDDGRIVGGVTTTIAQHPYMVQVMFNGRFICGGSIISKRLILTAAHCVYGYVKQPAKFKVRGGATFLNSKGGVTRNVAKIVRAQLYNPNNYNMDAAVLKLKGSMTGKNIKPIKLIQYAVPNDAVVRATGWGYTSEDGNVSNQLRSVKVKKISRDVCRKSYAKQGQKVTQNMVCASKPGKDSCSGDSGGPLTYNGRIAGIVSWGVGCARRNSPGVYTDITKIKAFVKRVRGSN